MKTMTASLALAATLALCLGAVFHQADAQVTPSNGGSSSWTPPVPGGQAGEITFPDGTVGSVIIRPINSFFIRVIQTIPDSTGRGMKSKITLYNTNACTEVCSSVVSFTNP